MNKKLAAAVVSACILSLWAGLGIGRYTAIGAGAVLRAPGGGPGIELPARPALDSRPVEVDFSQKSAKININTATAEQLTELPGIGDALAGRIAEYRALNGRFERVDELMAVRGIGESVFSKIQEYIYAE